MKLSDLSDEEWFKRLSARRDAQAAEARRWFQRYDGEQALYFIARLLSEQDDRFGPLAVNMSRKFIDTIDGLCETEGFQVNGAYEFDTDMWAAWTRNDMPEFESENNINSLVTGWGFVVVGPSDDGALITVESPEQMAVEIDPLTRSSVASLLFYKSDQEATTDDRAVLQVADERGARLVEFENGKPVAGGKPQGWMRQASKLQSSPNVPAVRYLNRQRQRTPQSELTSLAPLEDAVSLTGTQMLATAHHHAMPRMLAINVAESLFFNEDGSLNKEALKSAAGNLWIVPAEADDEGVTLPAKDLPEVDIKQLPASDLRNFHETLSHLFRVAAGLCDMSPAEFGFGIADNPESERSQTAKHMTMASRVRRVHKSRGAAHARVMRLAAAVEGRDLSAIKSIETSWLDPSKMTKAAMADAATKTLGSGISDLRQARIDYGYSPGQIAAMEARERRLARDPFRLADGEGVNDGDATDAPTAGA